MTEWWSYEAGDFLLFSPRVYWRLFEIHNQALWPAQIAALGLSILLAAGLLRPAGWPSRLCLPLLAAVWLWVAWSFLLQRYATINWAAVYIAPLFIAEGLLFAWLAIFRGGIRWQPTGLSAGLYLYALALHPFVGLVSGRPIAGAELFGLAPDPTAIATLGFLSAVQPGRMTWLLLAPPLLWCAVSAATLLALGAWEGWIPLAAIALTLAAQLGRHSKKTQDRS